MCVFCVFAMISAVDFEHEYVHTAYEFLASKLEPGVPKIWPFVDDFVSGFSPGSLIADVGCGEGKYLRAGKQPWMIGTDRSSSLSLICRSNGNEVATCDVTKMPFRRNMFDGIICISVIHHLATESRRVTALKELTRMLRRGGKVLITAWALENNYRKFICQDVLVPAEVARIRKCSCTQADSSKFSALSRLSIGYIKTHARRITNGVQDIISKEIESLKAKLRTASDITDTIQNYFTNRKRSLWLWVEDKCVLNQLGGIFRSNLRKTYSCGDLSSKRQEDCCCCPSRDKSAAPDQSEAEVERVNDGIHRYYHVFQKGELPRLILENAKGLKICKEWFEQGNWVVIAEKI